MLKDAGLVTDRAAGTRRSYRLNPTAVAALRDQLDTYWNRALAGYQDAVASPTQPTPPAQLAPAESRTSPRHKEQERP